MAIEKIKERVDGYSLTKIGKMARATLRDAKSHNLEDKTEYEWSSVIHESYIVLKLLKIIQESKNAEKKS